MRKQASQALIIAALALFAGGGCSQIQTVFHNPGDGAPAQTSQVSSRSVTVVDDDQTNIGGQTSRSNSGKMKLAKVASYQPEEVRTAPVQSKPNAAPQRQTNKTLPTPAESTASAKNMNTNGAERTDGINSIDQPDTRSADADQRRYTVPSAGVRSAGLLANSTAALALGTADNRSVASLSQSLVTSSQGVQSAAGLGAPAPTSGGVRRSITGGSAGPGFVFGGAGPNTILSRQVNLASGPSGGLCTLARAGLIGNNRACQTLRHKH